MPSCMPPRVIISSYKSITNDENISYYNNYGQCIEIDTQISAPPLSLNDDENYISLHRHNTDSLNILVNLSIPVYLSPLKIGNSNRY